MSERELLGLMAAVLKAGWSAGSVLCTSEQAVLDAEDLLAKIDAHERARREPPPAL